MYFSVDWTLGLAAHAPQQLTARLVDSLVQVWQQLPTSLRQLSPQTQQPSTPPQQLLSLLSPTSLNLLAGSAQPQNTWQRVGHLAYRIR